jgi:hypothetical protein
MKGFLLFLIFVIIAIVGVYIFSDFDYFYSLFNKENNTQPTLIECYINGRRIQATREDCQALSIKKEPEIQQPVVIQQKPRIEVPKLEPPNVRCDNQYDLFGNYIGVNCYKSWF